MRRAAARAGVVALALVTLGCSDRGPSVDPVLTRPADDTESLVLMAREALAREGITHLRWGVTPYVKDANLQERYQPLIGHLADRLDVTMSIEIGPGYAALEERVLSGDLDIGILSPFSYVRTRRRDPGVAPFASHIAQGSTTYGAYVITRADGPVRTLADLPRRAFGFVDEGSTSGWLFPAELMLRHGLHPKRGLEARFLGSHDAVYDAVVDRSIDAGAVYSGEMHAGRLRHPEAEIRIIAKTRRVPYDAYVTRSGLPAELARALGALIREISTANEAGRRLLAPLPDINGFVTVDDSHYDVIREVDARVRNQLEAATNPQNPQKPQTTQNP